MVEGDIRFPPSTPERLLHTIAKEGLAGFTKIHELNTDIRLELMVTYAGYWPLLYQ
jgi:hypothetical protein